MAELSVLVPVLIGAAGMADHGVKPAADYRAESRGLLKVR